MQENNLQSVKRIYEEDGVKITIIREFDLEGSTILEQVIDFLIDQMNNSNNQILENKYKNSKDIDNYEFS